MDLAEVLELPVTPWTHIFFTHSWWFMDHLGGLKWCANWGLEAAHRWVKSAWQRSTKRGGHPKQRRGVVQMLCRSQMHQRIVHAQQKVKRRRLPRRNKAHWAKVLQHALTLSAEQVAAPRVTRKYTRKAP